MNMRCIAVGEKNAQAAKAAENAKIAQKAIINFTNQQPAATGQSQNTNPHPDQTISNPKR